MRFGVEGMVFRDLQGFGYRLPRMGKLGSRVAGKLDERDRAASNGHHNNNNNNNNNNNGTYTHGFLELLVLATPLI